MGASPCALFPRLRNGQHRRIPIDSDHLFWGYKDYGVTAVAEIRSPGSFEYAVGYDYQRFWGEDEVWLIQDKTETAQALYGQIRTSREQLEHSSVALGIRYNTTSGTFDGTVWNLSGFGARARSSG